MKTCRYVPSAGVVLGLSKLARLTKHFGKRLQSQDKLACEIATGLQTHLQCEGVAVLIEARQLGPLAVDPSRTVACISGCVAENRDQCEVGGRRCAWGGERPPCPRFRWLAGLGGERPPCPRSSWLGDRGGSGCFTPVRAGWLAEMGAVAALLLFELAGWLAGWGGVGCGGV